MEFLSRRWGCAVLVLALVGGCRAATSSPPSNLIDSSPARPPAIALETVEGPIVVTVVHVTPVGADAAGSTAASCIAATGVGPASVVVERVGVVGRSITFLGPDRRTAHACDASGADRRRAGGWCGHAFAQVERGRARDPRLSLTCRSPTGDPVGFAWIQPGAGTAYIVVKESGYAEVYATAADAPVRVTTTDADLMSARATFPISEHRADGRRLRSYELEAEVAG